MTTLSTLTTRLLQFLGDNPVAPTRYPAALTNEAIRQAAGEYSTALPLISSAALTVTAAGRGQPLSSLSRLTAITRVVYPWVDESSEAEPLKSYYLYFSSGAPVVYIGGERIPAVGEKLQVTYAATHILDDLDGAASCTIPAVHFNLLVQGAAGYAASFRSAAIIEAYTSRDPDAGQVGAFGSKMLAAFRGQLLVLRIQASPQPLPGSGFRLDAWDAS
jgi:hypothetical protein